MTDKGWAYLAETKARLQLQPEDSMEDGLELREELGDSQAAGLGNQ